MNSACPTCGAVYAVTSKDVGRKLKCKKCSTALAVTDAGLVVDGSAVAPAIPAAPVAAVVADDFGTGDEVVSPKGKKGKRYSGPKGPGLGETIGKIGGIPTILFGIGTFLIIWFTFMEPIGQAAITRAQANVNKLTNEREAELKKLMPKGKKSELELEGDERKTYEDKAKKIREDYEKRIEDARESASNAEVDNTRSIWFDKYGQLFGFLFLAFGCIGYLRTDQPLVMRIVAAVVLGVMLLLIFSLAVSGCGGSGPRLPIPRPGGGGGIK
jgi:predicted Zn finger-like uncharacterized protein